MTTKSYKGKLQKVVESIDDADIRDVVRDIIDTERYHRSLDELPINEIIHIIDNKVSEMERNDLLRE